jgi:hypothetical protein
MKEIEYGRLSFPRRVDFIRSDRFFWESDLWQLGTESWTNRDGLPF